jgi:hypothetical protein
MSTDSGERGREGERREGERGRGREGVATPDPIGPEEIMIRFGGS